MCFEPYVRIMGFFVETMGDDGGGGDEVGGAVLGELLKETIGGAPFGVSVWTLWNALSEASGCLPIVDGHSRIVTHT